MSTTTYVALEAALRAHVLDEGDPELPLLTDWYLVCATVGADPSMTHYVHVCSDTAQHPLEGLLHRGIRHLLAED